MTEKKLGGITVTILLSAIILCSSLSAGAAAHKIRSGDSLWSIAKKYHTTPKAIARANRISEKSTLALGKTLSIPGKQSSASSKRQLRSAAAQKRYARAHKPAQTKKITAKNPSATKTTTTVAKTTPVRSSSTDHSTLIRTALACRGARYRRGGTSRGGFDCSGFTRYVFAKYGVTLPHSSAAQASIGKRVSKSELKPGDLVFFHTYRRGVSHVGIYIGNGNFVHAATYGRGVRIDALSSSYYSRRYVGARRVKQTQSARDSDPGPASESSPPAPQG